ncbi:MAG: twin-arginine translocation signal domain-containing protein [Planctomycetota bacterium]
MNLNRRDFLKASAAVAGALALKGQWPLVRLSVCP